MLKGAFLIVEAEKQRAHTRACSILMPAKTCDGAIGCPRVLYFDHRALAGLVDPALGFRDHTIETSAFEPREPIRCGLPIAGHRREIDRRRDAGKKPLETRAPLGKGRRAKIAPGVGKQIECDE